MKCEIFIPVIIATFSLAVFAHSAPTNGLEDRATAIHERTLEEQPGPNTAILNQKSNSDPSLDKTPSPQNPEGLAASDKASQVWNADTPAEYAEIQAGFARTVFDDEGKPLMTSAEGNVQLRYKDVLVTAAEAVVDWKAKTADFHKDVVFRIHSQEIRGSSLRVNLDTREWQAESLRTSITPEVAKGYLLAPVFAESSSVFGTGSNYMGLRDAKVTTCDLPIPHYELVSQSVAIYANDKAVFRNVAIYALGRHIFTLPQLTIPLREMQRNPNIIPRVGQNQEEGLFIKTSYSYLATRSSTGSVLLDLMSRKGIGKGLQQSWQRGNTLGSLLVYHVYDRTIKENTLTGKFSHTQTLGSTRLNLTSDFRSNSYLYAPQSSSFANQLSLSRESSKLSTTLLISQNVNNAYVRTSRLAATLAHRQSIGQSSSLNASIDYTAYTFDQTRARITPQATFEQKTKHFDWNLSVQRVKDLSDEAFIGQGVFGGIEKLHEIGFVSDSNRLGIGVPLDLKLTYGNYSELPSPIGLGRAYFEATTPVRRYSLSNTWTLDTGAGFRQYVYTDSTAQYCLDAIANISKRLGPTSSMDFVYRRQQVSGFAPFRFDYMPRYNIANLNINYRDNQRFRFSILTGYNFNQPDSPWQDITLRLAFQPTRSVLLYTATGYDLNRSQWRTLINQLRIRAGGCGSDSGSDTAAGQDCAFKLDIGTRYDTQLSRLAMARSVLDARIGRLWRLQANAGYNGFTKEFDYTSVMVTRDLHCWEASVAFVNRGGFYRSRGITFTLHIKAFPLFQDFGVGAFGQALDTSVGEIY